MVAINCSIFDLQKESQSLRPVTIKQIALSQPVDSVFRIDDVPVGQVRPLPFHVHSNHIFYLFSYDQVTFVGVILEVNVQNTKIEYGLDDGTGQITVKRYVDSNDDDQGRNNELRYSTRFDCQHIRARPFKIACLRTEKTYTFACTATSKSSKSPGP